MDYDVAASLGSEEPDTSLECLDGDRNIGYSLQGNVEGRRSGLFVFFIGFLFLLSRHPASYLLMYVCTYLGELQSLG